ncbi:MAG: hypothetical protein MK132_16145 [Lentisphaerales bacterium]|nr:hypothetical protein [Lentisphaerales bacterium]
MIEAKMNECARLIIDGQQKGGAFYYSYNTASANQNTSLSGFNWQALKAVYGAGCSAEGLQEIIIKSIQWLKGVADSASF